MISKARIFNFKGYIDSIIDLDDGLNIIVGDNESGKSTLLEAITLAATAKIDGRFLFSHFSSHMINDQAKSEYLHAIWGGRVAPLPVMFIEIYLKADDAIIEWRGTANSLSEDCPGLRIEARFDEQYASEYQELLSNPSEVRSLPIEYYKVEWKSFSKSHVSSARTKLSISLIDASRLRLSSGTDYYLQQIIADGLTSTQRISLNKAYRASTELFSEHDSIRALNFCLDAQKGDVTSKELSLGIDTSEPRSWESGLTPYLDKLPVSFAGSGEQNKLKILLALSRSADDAHILLIEEPENHLSFSSMSSLVRKISDRSVGKQVILTTHSSYVVNKLGIGQLKMLNAQNAVSLNTLPPSTVDYFRKLPGHDTLRIVLAKKVILVEGPSDELIVQRAYLDRHGVRPLENGVDVLSVRGLSFKRFLDISKALGRETAVITDNDGDREAVLRRFDDYSQCGFINIYTNMDPSLSTLEPSIVAANDTVMLSRVLGRPLDSDFESLVAYMTRSNNKTECALRIHDSGEAIKMPSYIERAVDAS